MAKAKKTSSKAEKKLKKKAKPVKAKAKTKAKPAKASKPLKPKSRSSSVAERAEKVERLLAKGKDRGFVTYSEILKEFPTVEEDITFLDELYAKFQTSGIDVLEGGNMLEKEVEEPVHKKNVYLGKGGDSSYDSIQMYLKEIGQYPLIGAKEEKA